MKRITLALLCLFTLTTVAQSNSINYKALIKDANNAVVANTQVTVQFSILQGVAQTNVYQETHNPTTDANGIVIINIGEGTVVSGVFDDIAWASDTHFLNTQIDTGSGLTDMGTTAFNAVPYALSAKTAENVSGLEAIDEGNGLGLVKVGRVEANYGDIGYNAVDLSYNNQSSTTRGATGNYSTAMGYRITASGNSSTAIGENTTASGFRSIAIGNLSNAVVQNSTAIGRSANANGQNSTAIGYLPDANGIGSTAIGNNADANERYSTAIGNNADANGEYSTAIGDFADANGYRSTAIGNNADANGGYSTAIGYLTDANGTYSTAMGRNTKAESYGETVFGLYNTIIVPNSAIDFNLSDRLLVVGNGTADLRSDALVILKNGTITAPSLDISEITDPKAIVTKEFADEKYLGFDDGFSGDYYDLLNVPSGAGNTGLEARNEGNGIGLVKVDRVAENYGNVGLGAVDLSYSEDASTTRGATGQYSVAMGQNTRAEGFNSTAIGRFNIGGGNPTVFNSTDPLFEVGNGSSDSNRSNALTILKNGNTTINGNTIVNGNTTMNGTISAITTSDNAPSLIVSGSANTGAGDNGIISSHPDYLGSDLFLKSNDAVHIYLDSDENEAGNFEIFNGAGSSVFNVDEAGNTVVTGNTQVLGNVQTFGTTDNYGLVRMFTGASIFGNVTVNGAVVHASDRRLKKEIETIPFGLKEILQLEPKAYNWKTYDQEYKSLGLIAQDVQAIIKNVVQVRDDKDQTLGVSYTELIPVLIKATQEQQVIIEAQAKKIEQLEAQNKQLATIETRLSALEMDTSEDEVDVATSETTKE